MDIVDYIKNCNWTFSTATGTAASFPVLSRPPGSICPLRRQASPASNCSVLQAKFMRTAAAASSAKTLKNCCLWQIILRLLNYNYWLQWYTILSILSNEILVLWWYRCLYGCYFHELYTWSIRCSLFVFVFGLKWQETFVFDFGYGRK